MPMFLHQWGYKDESVRAMVVEREDRQEVVRLATEAFGGTLHHFYYCFGDYDGCAISEFADAETALACVMAVFGQGRVRAVKTTLLLTPEQGARAIGHAWEVVAKRDVP
jgi:uncharacterized protein with GYD domain